MRIHESLHVDESTRFAVCSSEGHHWIAISGDKADVAIFISEGAILRVRNHLEALIDAMQESRTAPIGQHDAHDTLPLSGDPSAR